MARKKKDTATGKVPEKDVGLSALAQARSVMNKVFPDEKSSEVRIDEARFTQSHPHLPTGSVIIDFLIGGVPNRAGVLPCPGFPRGRLINLYGAETSGKTTMALTVAAETCRRGGCVGFIDWEHAIDVAYAKSLGVPIDEPDRFLLLQPETLEKGLAYLWGMVKAGVDLVIIDSVAAGATTAQWDQKLEDKGEIGRVGAKAAKWSEYLPQLKAMMARTNTCVVGISQLRSKINTGGGGGFNKGPQTTQQGGYAWKFYSEVRLGLRRIATEKGKRYDPMTHTNIEVPVANVVLAKIDKCKVSASQGREAKFYLVFGEGIDDVRSMIDLSAKRGLVKKAGSWYSWERADGSSLRAQGIDGFKDLIRTTPGAWEEIHTLALQSLNASPDAPIGIGDDFNEDDESETIREVMAIVDGQDPTKKPEVPSAEEVED